MRFVVVAPRFCLFLAFAFFAASSLVSNVEARTADLTLAPTRIVLEKDKHYATVNIKNAGDATGRYRIEIVDATMKENGGVHLLDDGQRDPFSAYDHISISPRSMTLSSGDYQTVRILIKNMAGMPDGELRSELRVTMTETDVEADTNQPKDDAIGIKIKPRLVMAIPIIIRHGETSFQATIDDAKFAEGTADAPQPVMHVSLGFQGNRSVIGDIKITHVDKEGKESLLKLFPGVAIYRGVPKIDLDVPLEIPEGVDIHSGKTTVAYMTQDSDGGGVMAQKDVTP